MDWGWDQGIKSHHTDVSRNLATVVVRGVLPGLRRKRTGLLPSGPKSSFQMRASFVFHLETKVLESEGRVEKLIAQVAWSPVLSFHSLWWFGVLCHLLMLVHCVFWKPTLLHSFTKKVWSTSCFLLLTSFLKMLISFSSRIWHLPTLPKHQKLVKWPWCWCAWLASKFTRPEPHRESMGYCQEENQKQETKKCRWAKGHGQRNLGFIPPQQCHKPITSMPRRIEAVIKAKEPLPSIEYIYSKWTYFPEGQEFTKKKNYWSYEVFEFVEVN